MFTPEEQSSIRHKAALELARYKMQVQAAKGHAPLLDDSDLNEIFIVANLPLLGPGELDQELKMINLEREDAE